jgi:hypothetical protein
VDLTLLAVEEAKTTSQPTALPHAAVPNPALGRRACPRAIPKGTAALDQSVSTITAGQLLHAISQSLGTATTGNSGSGVFDAAT